MNILLVSATQFEIEPTLKFLNKLNGNILNGNVIYHLNTGVGAVATNYHLTKFLVQNKIDFAINVGVAGAITPMENGTVVNVITDAFYELGAEDNDNFIPLNEMGILTQNDVPLTNDYIEVNPPFPVLQQIEILQKACGITVNKVHGNAQSILKLQEYISNRNNPLPFVESMEGAAFVYVCYKEDVPCLQLRSISNKVEPRNRNNWQMELAIKNLNKKLIDILNVL